MNIFIWTSPDKIKLKNIKIGLIFVCLSCSPLISWFSGDKTGLLAAGFNSSHPVKITIHGFSDKSVTSWTDVSKVSIVWLHYNSVSVYRYVKLEMLKNKTFTIERVNIKCQSGIEVTLEILKLIWVKHLTNAGLPNAHTLPPFSLLIEREGREWVYYQLSVSVTSCITVCTTYI